MKKYVIRDFFKLYVQFLFYTYFLALLISKSMWKIKILESVIECKNCRYWRIYFSRDKYMHGAYITWEWYK